MRLREWRTRPDLILQAQEWLKLPITDAVIEILRTEAPGQFSTQLGLNETDCVKWLGRIEGYQLCLNNIMALTTEEPQTKHVESTFEGKESNARRR